MIPYANGLYFAVVFVPIVITVGLGLAGRMTWRWTLLTTLFMLVVQYGGGLGPSGDSSLGDFVIVAGYAVFQWAVATQFLRIRTRATRWDFYGAVGLALLPLAFVKLAPADAAAPLGFLGLSYVTIRGLDVIFGVQDRLITSLPPGQYFTYLFFFPTISAGPIDRYRRFAAEYPRTRTRIEFLHDLDGATQRIFAGMLYKFILAALVKQYWMDPAAAGGGLLHLASYMYAYSAYLFFDFAGYSAFAIGFSYLFGIHTPENFQRPFLAENIAEFWNRWHISLSTWFRDHIYMRFILAATRGRWFEDKHVASYLGFFLTFGLMGLWHGTEARYLVYGAYHACLLAGHGAWIRRRKRDPARAGGALARVAGIALTFNLVCFGFLIFSGRLG